MWFYIQSEYHAQDGCDLWTVGFYDPSGRFHSDSDYNNRHEAAARAAWLNGAHVNGAGEASETILRIMAALDTEETGDNLVSIAKDAHRAELELAQGLRRVED